MDFLNCVEHGGTPVATGEIGREAVAAERSIETGAPAMNSEVDWDVTPLPCALHERSVQTRGYGTSFKRTASLFLFIWR